PTERRELPNMCVLPVRNISARSRKADQGFCRGIHLPLTRRKFGQISLSPSSDRRTRREGYVRLTYRDKLRDRDRQIFFVTYLAGKMIGLVAALGAVFGIGTIVIGQVAHAQDTSEQLTSVINGTNTAWVLVAAFLVFFMQAGFMMLEAGFARTREVVNILQECIVDTCLCALLFWAWGFAFMFGRGNGFIGHEFFFLNGAPATYDLTGAVGVSFM